jgi:hypothetical protein
VRREIYFPFQVEAEKFLRDTRKGKIFRTEKKRMPREREMLGEVEPASWGVGGRGVGEGGATASLLPPSGCLLPPLWGRPVSVRQRRPHVRACPPAKYFPHRNSGYTRTPGGPTGLPGSSATINRGPRAFPRPRATHPSASSPPSCRFPNKDQQRKVSHLAASLSFDRRASR